MKKILFSTLWLALIACGSAVAVDEGNGGASTSSTSATGTAGGGGGCIGSPVWCADGCGSDYFPAEADCIGGDWVCPPGTVDPADCPAGTCWGPPLPCEVCGDSGWACELTPECVTGCGGIVCAVCPDDPGSVILGACECSCNGNQTDCTLAPGCCQQDMDCGDETYVPCVNQVCKMPVAGKCWSDAECPPGSVCVGASVCPCGYDCDGPDAPGDCVAPP